MELHLTATECHLLYSVTCHPTQVNAPRLNPSQKTGRYSIYLYLHGVMEGFLGDLLHAGEIWEKLTFFCFGSTE